MKAVIKYFVTYNFEGTPLTLCQSAPSDKAAVEMANVFASRRNMEVLRISTSSPRLRSYFSSISSIATRSSICYAKNA